MGQCVKSRLSQGFINMYIYVDVDDHLQLDSKDNV